MSELNRNRAVIHYEAWGQDENPEGAWVTLVNGHTRPLNDFRMMGKHLVGLGYRVLALDNRGAGQTTYSGSFSLKDMADDVAALWDELKIEETAVLGISMGGFIAQTLTQLHPDRMTKLILISTAPGQQHLDKHEVPWTADVHAVQKKLNAYFTPSFAQRNATLVASMAKQIAKGVVAGTFKEGAAAQRQAIGKFDNDQLDAIEVPTLVIHGSEDAIIKVAAAEELAGGIPNAEKVLLPSAGHLLLAEKPRELYDLVGKFLARN